MLTINEPLIASKSPTRGLFRQNMKKVYLHGDWFMQWYLLAHVFISLGLAFVYSTWAISLTVAAAASFIFYLPKRLFPGSVLTRNMAGVSLAIFVILHIYQMHGLAEMHFFFFTASTAMLVYQDWRCLWPGVLLIVAQHLAFAILNNSGYEVYFFEDSYIPFMKLFFHFGIVAAQALACSYFAHLLRERTRLDAEHSDQLAQQGDLLETAFAKLEAVDKGRTDDLQHAKELQQNLAPGSLLSLKGFNLVVGMETCTEVGGDYYDYYVHPNGKVTLALGDATGQGLKAAIVVAACKSLFQTFIKRTDIGQTYKFISEGIENLKVKGVYMGLTLIEIEGDVVKCISSGMPPVLFFHGNTKTISQLSEPGAFIGIASHNLNPKIITKKARPGDKLMLSTDGLFERFDKSRRFMGYHQLQEVFQKVAPGNLNETMQSLLDYSNGWLAGAAATDDTTVLVAEFVPTKISVN